MRFRGGRGGVSLRAVCGVVIVGVLVVSGVTLYSTNLLAAAFERLVGATEDQIAMANAARDLMDASDYLTERAQRFTIDGDRRFMDEYFTEAFETSRREDAIRRMSGDARFSSALAQLQEALDESVELMGREYYAMRLVIDAKGYAEMPDALTGVELSEEDRSLAPEDKMRRATEMVLDDEYYRQKDLIRADMRESLGELEDLTRRAESEALEDLEGAAGLVRAVVVAQVVGAVVVVWVAIRFIVAPLLRATERVRMDELVHVGGPREFRYLAQTYNELSERLVEENERLKVASQTDALTGLRNRLALRNDYDLYTGHQVSVLLLDLDDFKMINDTYGHEAGDRVLAETGALLAEAFGPGHCYRYGGDEFLVVAPDLGDAAFHEALERVMDGRPRLPEGEGRHTQVGYSVGYVSATLDGHRELRDLFSEADQRMYRVKRERKQAAGRSDVRERGRDGSAPVIGEGSFTTGELRTLIDNVSGMYDLVRVVDPSECRVMEIGRDGTISLSEQCYGIWKSDQKCVNCTSSVACLTRRNQRKDELFEGRVFHVESNPVRLRLPDGAAYDAVVELVSVDGDEGAAATANDRAAEDVNDRAAQYQAHHDDLTNALKSSAFSELAREAIARRPGTSWVVATSNVMDFKLVNTLFGVQRANDALVMNANLLQRLAQRDGGLCGRLGGDQFALIVPRESFDVADLAQVADALRAEFSSGLYTFRIHFGVYEVEDTSIPVSVMCDRANAALRTIREDLGRTVAVFDDAMMRRNLFEHEVVSGFEQALAEGQFRMYLQPLVSEDGHVLGAEALCRWHRPSGETIMPGDFIETLEHAGLIHLLDAYMWECAVAQLAAWTDTPLAGITISVNVSAKDFFSLDVFGVLTELTERYGVACERLKVEITETSLIEEMERGNAMLARLRERGFIVEIDDFGKDNSSLGLLKDVQADVLKIDMGLTREIEQNHRSRAIVASVVGMAESLGMGVVTEGVETEEQLDLLIDMGCHQFQGYYFSRPITVEEFEARIRG